MLNNYQHVLLITGADGFLGKQLVMELIITHPGARIVALVRDPARARLSQWLQEQRIDGSRVEIVAADITNSESCELSLEMITGLQGVRVDVFHCAANYDLVHDDRTVNSRVNVEGTANVLDLAVRLGAHNFHHISTIAVAGKYHGMWTEEHLTETSTWASSYGRTKHQSEILVRDSAIPVKNVFRLGVLVGDAGSGSYFKNDGIYRFLPALQNMIEKIPRAMPLPTIGWGAIPLCPIDHAARAIVALAAENEPGYAVHHIFEDEVLRADEIMQIVIEAASSRQTTQWGWLGHISTEISAQAKHDEVVAGLKRDVLSILTDAGVPRELLAELNSPTRFGNAETSKKLAQLGIVTTSFREYAPRIWFGWLADREINRRQAQNNFFRGKRVVLTGGTSGIGSRILRKILDGGGRVVVLGRNEEKLASAVRGVDDSNVYFLACDLLDPESVTAAAAELVALDGIDVFIHSAGVSIDRPLLDMSEDLEEVVRMVQVNFVAPLQIIRSIAGSMAGRGDARVVNLSSISTELDIPGFGPYSSTKAALDQALAVLRTELHGSGITFTSVRLPLVKSPMTHLNIRLRNVPMLSESAAAELVLSATTSGQWTSQQPIGKVFEILKIVQPQFASALSTIGWKAFLRVPYASRLIDAALRSSRR